MSYDYLCFHALKIFFFYILIILILVFVRVWNEVEHQRQLCTIYDLHLHLQKLSIKSFFNYRDGMLLTQWFFYKLCRCSEKKKIIQTVISSLGSDLIQNLSYNKTIFQNYSTHFVLDISYKTDNRYLDISNDIFETYLNSPFKNH